VEAGSRHPRAIPTQPRGTAQQLAPERPGFYGYKLPQAVCAETGLPLTWRVETAKANEASVTVPLTR
jgi:hypothetical protein